MTDHTPEQAAYLDLLTRVQALEDAIRLMAKENQSLRRRILEFKIVARAGRPMLFDHSPGAAPRLTANPDRGRIAKS